MTRRNRDGGVAYEASRTAVTRPSPRRFRFSAVPTSNRIWFATVVAGSPPPIEVVSCFSISLVWIAIGGMARTQHAANEGRVEPTYATATNRGLMFITGRSSTDRAGIAFCYWLESSSCRTPIILSSRSIADVRVRLALLRGHQGKQRHLTRALHGGRNQAHSVG
jgi:hypothetical protein